jgi:hypothetical protein
MRFIFSIGKMYEINGEYGFPIYAHKITIKRTTKKYITFTDFSDED